MIKVRYNANTGQVLKRYPASIDVPQPFVEITEGEANALHDLPVEQAWFYSNGEFVIGDSPEYLAKQKQKDIHKELSEIYEDATLLQQAKYKPVRDAVQEYLESGEFDKIEALLLEAKDNLEPDVQPIAEAIYNKYMKLKQGG